MEARNKERAEFVRLFKQRTDHLKARGKGLYANNNLVEAIQAYQQGFVLCNQYFEHVNRVSPMRCDFQGAEEVKENDDLMWL